MIRSLWSSHAHILFCVINPVHAYSIHIVSLYLQVPTWHQPACGQFCSVHCSLVNCCVLSWYWYLEQTKRTTELHFSIFSHILYNKLNQHDYYIMLSHGKTSSFVIYAVAHPHPQNIRKAAYTSMSLRPSLDACHCTFPHTRFLQLLLDFRVVLAVLIFLTSSHRTSHSVWAW